MLDQGWQTFSDKGLTVNISGLVGHVVTVTILCYCSNKLSLAKIIEHGCAPIKLFFLNTKIGREGWAYSSVAEHLLSMC